MADPTNPSDLNEIKHQITVILASAAESIKNEKETKTRYETNKTAYEEANATFNKQTRSEQSRLRANILKAQVAFRKATSDFETARRNREKVVIKDTMSAKEKKDIIDGLDTAVTTAATNKETKKNELSQAKLVEELFIEKNKQEKDGVEHFKKEYNTAKEEHEKILKQLKDLLGKIKSIQVSPENHVFIEYLLTPLAKQDNWLKNMINHDLFKYKFLIDSEKDLTKKPDDAEKTHTVRLGYNRYELCTGKASSARRTAYFNTPKPDADLSETQRLTSEEIRLLADLGIPHTLFTCTTPNKAITLLPWMAAFFDQLPDCQSDTSLTLAKDCEVVHYVLWYIMFVDRETVQGLYAQSDARYKPAADITVAMTQHLLDDTQSRTASCINTANTATNTTNQPKRIGAAALFELQALP